jgi:anti-anti-sigma factor
MAEFSVEPQGDGCRLLLLGDLTASLVPSLRDALKAQVGRGAKELVFDLEHTRILDSSGIGLLIATHNSLARVGAKMAVRNVSADLLHLLQTMRLVGRLNVAGKAGSGVSHG